MSAGVCLAMLVACGHEQIEIGYRPTHTDTEAGASFGQGGGGDPLLSGGASMISFGGQSGGAQSGGAQSGGAFTSEAGTSSNGGADNGGADNGEAGLAATAGAGAGAGAAGASANSSVCGNGLLERGETCDDGLNIGAYGGCTHDCKLGPHCGDDLIDPNYEECDDGNLVSGDGCSDTCLVEEQL